MMWGVRRNRRANRFLKVGTGKGNNSEKLRSYTDLGPIDLVKGRGFKGGALRKGVRITNANKNIKNGEFKARSILTYAANTRQQDLLPTSKSAANTKAAIGASLAAAILISAGQGYLKARSAA